MKTDRTGPRVWPSIVRCGLLIALVSPGPASWAQSGDLAAGRPDEPSYLPLACDHLVLQQWRNSDSTRLDDLCTGDRLVQWDGQPLQDNDDLVRRWLEKKAGQRSRITVQRETEVDGATQTRELEIEYTHEGASSFYAACMEGGRVDYPSAAAIHAEWESLELPLRDVVLEGLGPEGQPVLAALAGAFSRFTDSVVDHYRSDQAVYLMNRPFHAEIWARHFVDPLAAATRPSELLQPLWQLASPRGEPLPSVPDANPPGNRFADYLASLDQRLQAIDDAMNDALADLSDDQRQQLATWCQNFQPVWRGEDGWDEFVAGIQLTKRVRSADLARSIALAGQLLNDIVPGGVIFEGLKRTAAEAEIGRNATRTRVLGLDDDNVRVTTDIVIDLGGNDVYLFDNETGRRPFASRIIIDLAGDDVYLNRGGGLVSAIGGAWLLVDSAGDDRYLGENNSLGFALLGVAVLWDAAGQDHYQGGRFSQGAACLGVGLIVDLLGNDRYDAAAYSQAIGLPAGCGAILDRAGDDVYCCTGGQASGYGDVGEYEGWGQGCGWGFRGAAAGGIGILLDSGGRDFYRVGQFGLGCGYFFGVGLVNDRDGDDVYECSRYGLGTAAHYAVGMVLDDAGNDRYLAVRTSAVAELGSSWDLAAGVVIDSGGDDFYQVQSYALGGAAQNAWGLFWDKAGRDIYRSAGGSPGEAAGYTGGASYGAGRLARNVSLFLDEGAADDLYLVPGRDNNARGVNGEYAVWCDR